MALSVYPIRADPPDISIAAAGTTYSINVELQVIRRRSVPADQSLPLRSIIYACLTHDAFSIAPSFENASSKAHPPSPTPRLHLFRAQPTGPMGVGIDRNSRSSAVNCYGSPDLANRNLEAPASRSHLTTPTRADGSGR